MTARTEPGAVDIAAVTRFQSGEREAFGELVDRHRDRIYGLALKMTGHPEDALDVTQDTFVKALAKLGTLTSPAYFGTWLYRIGINTAITRLRGRVRERPEEDVELSGGTRLAGSSGLAGPVATLGERERRELIRQALAALPEAQRVAVVLCDLEGHSYESIARLMDISKGTVMSRIHYGRKRLREALTRVLEP